MLLVSSGVAVLDTGTGNSVASVVGRVGGAVTLSELSVVEMGAEAIS